MDQLTPTPEDWKQALAVVAHPDDLRPKEQGGGPAPDRARAAALAVGATIRRRP